MRKLEQLLVQLTIFLIPTNLAYHLYLDDAYLNGRLSDYLVPKIYLSDVPILGVILIYLLNLIILKRRINILKYKYIIIFFLYLAIRSIFTSSPLSSVWYVLKVIELLVFGTYLFNTYTRSQLLRLCSIPLLASLGLQSITALYQYVSQSSLIGYYFLGEPDLAGIGLAKESWLGTLKTLPYGTTAHPNILAGFIVSSIWVLHSTQTIAFKWIRIHNSPKYYVGFILKSLIISLSLLTLFLTQSQTALLATICIFTVNLYKHSISSIFSRLSFKISIFSVLAFFVLFVLLSYQLKPLADSPSISTRYELILKGFSVIKSNILLGVGPNQFTTRVSHISIPGQKVLFIQPVHNILLLSIAEIGIIGFLILCLAKSSFQIRRDQPRTLNSDTISIAFIIGILGGLDHYLLTLQTGQLILTLLLVLSVQFFNTPFKS